MGFVFARCSLVELKDSHSPVFAWTVHIESRALSISEINAFVFYDKAVVVIVTDIYAEDIALFAHRLKFAGVYIGRSGRFEHESAFGDSFIIEHKILIFMLSVCRDCALSALGHFLYNIEKLRHGDMLKHERRQIVSVFGFELFAARDIPFYLLFVDGRVSCAVFCFAVGVDYI